MLKNDNIRLGLVLGFLAPIFGMVLYYFAAFYRRDVGFSEFMYYMAQPKLLTAVSSISLIANALIFTLYVNAGKDKTLKGIFISTVIYGVAVLLIKLFA